MEYHPDSVLEIQGRKYRLQPLDEDYTQAMPPQKYNKPNPTLKMRLQEKAKELRKRSADMEHFSDIIDTLDHEQQELIRKIIED